MSANQYRDPSIGQIGEFFISWLFARVKNEQESATLSDLKSKQVKWNIQIKYYDLFLVIQAYFREFFEHFNYFFLHDEGDYTKQILLDVIMIRLSQ